MIRYREFALAKGSPTYSWQSLGISLIFALVVMIIRYGAHPFLKGPMDSRLDVKYGAASRDDQIDRLIKWVFDIIYYTATTIVGILILSQNSYLPTLFGGQGNCMNIMQTYPFTQELPWLPLFSLIQIGHHIYSLVDQIFTKSHHPDHHEMLLHHVITVALVVTGYLMNILALGTVTTVLLDPTDVLLCLTRFCSDIKFNSLLTGTIFFTTIVSWIFLRLYYFPTCVLTAMWHAYTHPIGEMASIAGGVLLFQITLLGALVPLSAYWVYRIARKGILILIGKKGVKAT